MAVGMAVQERAQLKERERAMRKAEEARKRTVRVTIDLLGRQVRSRRKCQPSNCSLVQHD
jgi:hypothetical protein